MSEITNVMIAGIGGQGSILSSKILALAALKAGLDVKQAEIHGMAQRGGSVITYIRFGKKVFSPIVSVGEADVIIAYEELEALRFLPYLKKGGLMIVNKQQTFPMPVLTGAAEYPKDPIGEMAAKGVKVKVVDGIGIGREKGDPRVANVVLLGVLANLLPLSGECWVEAMKESVKADAVGLNQAAFEAGRGA